MNTDIKKLFLSVFTGGATIPAHLLRCEGLAVF
jgi:hypothetical protein